MEKSASDRPLPRKVPRQERAKLTVEAVLEATAQVLLDGGVEGLSTNRVAKRAGVSIGSLYQYFPNKDALVAALLERHHERMQALLQEHIAHLLDAPIEQSIHTLVHSVKDVYMERPGLVQVLLQHEIQRRPLDHTMSFVERTQQMVQMYMHAHKDELVVNDLELAAYTVVRAAIGVWHTTSWEDADPAYLHRMANEIGDMACRYLLGPGHQAHHSSEH